MDGKEIQGLDNASITYLMDHYDEIKEFSEFYTFTDDLGVAYVYVAFIIIGLPANLIDNGVILSIE